MLGNYLTDNLSKEILYTLNMITKYVKWYMNKLLYRLLANRNIVEKILAKNISFFLFFSSRNRNKCVRRESIILLGVLTLFVYI